MPGVKLLLTNLGSGGLPRVNASVIYVRLQDLEERVFSWGRLWRDDAGRPSRARRSRGTSPSGRKCRRSAAIVTKYRRQFPELDLDCAVRNLTSFRQGAPVDIDLLDHRPEPG